MSGSLLFHVVLALAVVAGAGRLFGRLVGAQLGHDSQHRYATLGRNRGQRPKRRATA